MSDTQINFHRRSIRLRDYDYTQPGAYFITIVTRGHQCIFGKVINNNNQLSRLGMIGYTCWLALPNHFSKIEVEPFVVMPNHLHGIITIKNDDSRGTIYRAPTAEKFGKPVVESIPTIIRTYKAAVSRLARREFGMVNIWQRNYYEHIIRNESDMNDICDYILSNPVQWLDDTEYIQ